VPELKISAKIPAGKQHTVTAESRVTFTPTFIAAQGDTDAIRLVTIKVGGVEILSPGPAIPLIRIDRPRPIESEPLGPGRTVEVVLASYRDTPADVELVLSNEE
jgi:hypothetical protein